eukprot:scaffold213345_cov14-Tisochrysis_lutea.AAC.1
MQIKRKAPAEQQVTVGLDSTSLCLTVIQMHGSVVFCLLPACRAIQVKNKAPAERQITVEHILRESKEIQLEVRQEALPGMPG